MRPSALCCGSVRLGAFRLADTDVWERWTELECDGWVVQTVKDVCFVLCRLGLALLGPCGSSKQALAEERRQARQKTLGTPARSLCRGGGAAVRLEVLEIDDTLVHKVGEAVHQHPTGLAYPGLIFVIRDAFSILCWCLWSIWLVR